MQLGRVVGTVVSTQKHRKFEGAKLLLVQPLDARRQAARHGAAGGRRGRRRRSREGADRDRRAGGGRGARPQGGAGRCRHRRHRRHRGRDGMTEEELRALVRAAIARHAQAASEPPPLTSMASARPSEPRHADRACRIRNGRPVHDRARRDVQSLRVLQIDGTLTQVQSLKVQSVK